MSRSSKSPAYGDPAREWEKTPAPGTDTPAAGEPGHAGASGLSGQARPAPEQGPPADAAPSATPLQKRLEALVDSERKAQELQEELREQRWAAQQHDAARRLETMEAALAEAQAEAAAREAVEQTLGRVRLEAAKLAIELGQAERDAEEARRAAKPEAEQQLAELEEALSEARAEADRERASREELQQKLEAAVRAERGARDEAERISAEAQEQRKRAEAEAQEGRKRAEAEAQERERAEAEWQRERAELEERIEAASAREAQARQAHERELAELERARAESEAARVESERSATEAERAVARERTERKREQERVRAIEQLLEAATGAKAPEAIGAAPSFDTPKPVEARREAPQPNEASFEPPKPGDAADFQETPEDTPERPGFLRRRKRVFEGRGRTCAVCRRMEANSPGALKAEGWALGAEIDLCPDCQQKGWQLPKGGSLPFRRRSSREEAADA